MAYFVILFTHEDISKITPRRLSLDQRFGKHLSRDLRKSVRKVHSYHATSSYYVMCLVWETKCVYLAEDLEKHFTTCKITVSYVLRSIHNCVERELEETLVI